MKKFYGLLAFTYLLNTVAVGQNEVADCKQLILKLRSDLSGLVEVIGWEPQFNNNQLHGLGLWMLELKEHINKNSFGLFSGSGMRGQKCNPDIADIFRNFFGSNYQYIFNPDKFSDLRECTGNYNPELNTPQSMGRLKQIAFVLRAAFSHSGPATLKESEKDMYTAFHNYLYDEKNANDPGIVEFFYQHLDDMKKATGFDPDLKNEDKKGNALGFILTFKPHLQFYFGRAEEEYINADARNELSQLRTRAVSTEASLYRQNLREELLTGLRLIDTELSKLNDICDEISIDPANGFIKRITNYNPTFNAANLPGKPTGEAGILKPGHGWVLLGILNANGKIYREYGDLPHIGLYTKVNGIKNHFTTFLASTYHQVPAGTYFARISMAAYPQSGITVENGGETKLALRLGRLVLDPRNFDGTPGQQHIVIKAIVEKDETTEGAILTLNVVSNGSKGGDSLDLAPGRYEVRIDYGITQVDIITIQSQQSTKLTISGAAKFTSPKERIRISRIVANKPEYVAVRENGQDIQLPPGTYEIERPDILYKYRLKMERGVAYTYKRP